MRSRTPSSITVSIGPSAADELAGRIADGTLPEILRKMTVKAGDTFFIPVGTIHAIGPGLTLAEIQQNSNVTYRLFDYDRSGAEGKPRPLHIEKALDVADLSPSAQPDFAPHLGRCSYFTADQYLGPFQGACGNETFHTLLVLSGTGKLFCDGEQQELRTGNCWFLPAGRGTFRVEGNCRTLVVYIS